MAPSGGAGTSIAETDAGAEADMMSRRLRRLSDPLQPQLRHLNCGATRRFIHSQGTTVFAKNNVRALVPRPNTPILQAIPRHSYSIQIPKPHCDTPPYILRVSLAIEVTASAQAGPVIRPGSGHALYPYK